MTRNQDQRLAIGRLGALVESLETIVRSGRQVILVTSGATAVGRQKLRFQQVLNSSPLEMQMLGLSSLQVRVRCRGCHALCCCSVTNLHIEGMQKACVYERSGCMQLLRSESWRLYTHLQTPEYRHLQQQQQQTRAASRPFTTAASSPRRCLLQNCSSFARRSAVYRRARNCSLLAGTRGSSRRTVRPHGPL